MKSTYCKPEAAPSDIQVQGVLCQSSAELTVEKYNIVNLGLDM